MISTREQNLLDAAVEQFQAARDIFVEKRELLAIADVNYRLGSVEVDRGDYTAAAADLATARAQFETVGSQRGVSLVLIQLGRLHWKQCNYDDAERSLEEAREIHSMRGDRHGLADDAYLLGLVRCNQQRLDEALTLFNGARRLYHDLGMQRWADECDRRIEWLSRNH